MVLNNQIISESAAIFGQYDSDLTFGFVCGSRANANYSDCSDVDYFVVFREPDVKLEKELAEKFIILHKKHGLKHDHCGEIFSRFILDNLFDLFETFAKYGLSDFQSTTCYKHSCILSVSRKIQVVLNMLASVKVCQCGDLNILNEYERRARLFVEQMGKVEYFGCLPPKFSEEQSSLNSYWNQITKKIEGGDLLNSPIGINLSHFFNFSPDVSTISAVVSEVQHGGCPYSFNEMTLLSQQCLFTHKN